MSFDIDANGILNVAAEDKSTGNKNKITITNDTGRLSKEQIERMLKEAEEMKEQDRKAQQRIEAKNKVTSRTTAPLPADLSASHHGASLTVTRLYCLSSDQLEQYLYGIRASIQEEGMKDKLSEEDRKKVEEIVSQTLEWLQRNEAAEQEEFEYKLKEAEAVCSPIIKKVYEQGGGGGAGGGAGGMPDMSGMGGMPGMGGAGGGGAGGVGAGGQGPKVEEVD